MLLLIFLALPVFLAATISLMDRNTFASPIESSYLVIRSDSRGNGYFASKRNGRRMHNGVDLLAEMGAEVYAPRSGKVIAAGNNAGLGQHVILKHLDDITTVYGHLSQVCVAKGQSVRQGQILGRVGKTGNSNHPAIEPHLHFEVRKNGVPQDPMKYL